MSTTLSVEEIEQCRRAFATFDKDNVFDHLCNEVTVGSSAVGSGTIDVKELKETLASLGQFPTEEDLFIMISQIDEDDSGEVEFPEFLNVIEKQKEAAATGNDESNTIDAFVALGGEPDKTGKISVEKLSTTIKEFELNIDIDALVKEVDKDKSGFIEYKEFKSILQ